LQTTRGKQTIFLIGVGDLLQKVAHRLKYINSYGTIN